MSPERVRLRFDDHGIGRLTLVRADARNAIDPAMVNALAEASEACGVRPSLRALLIDAEGPAFSVGGDLRHFQAGIGRLASELDSMVGRYHDALGRLAELPVPVVCAVQGAIAGGALGLLWSADVSLIALDAKLATGFIRLGLSGDGGSSWWLPRLVGIARARELLLGGRVLSGAEAAEWGMVTRAVPAERLEQDALAAVRVLAAGPTVAYGEVRQLLAHSLERELVTGLHAEREAMVRCGANEEARERIAAFPEQPGAPAKTSTKAR